MAQTINKPFKVTSGKSVTFDVVIGHGQKASSILRAPDGTATKHQNSFTKSLGEGGALKGKEVSCTTIVTDVQNDTDDTNLDLTVEDGVTKLEQSREETADRPGGVVLYSIVVRFQ